ncbi:DUF6377 domain-containing protein [Rufibacter roseolus]|uniref:DUF6377 domain-containing protein n=1 Tax=Rufibacter roseolus TaxID=2817375 RepID=UPI001B315057|nr:DUF6377 domain-containing protein [Rufibacter roseolus]
MNPILFPTGKNLWVALALLLSCVVCPSNGQASPVTDSLLTELSQTIKNNESYIEGKNRQLDQLKNSLKNGNSGSLLHQFTVYDKLVYQYRAFKYDSAFAYALKLQEVARKMNDPVRVTHAKLKLSFILVSSGMYNEALDSLENIRATNLPDSVRLDYYALKSRAYYDLSGYTQDIFYSSRYSKKGEIYADSALALLDESKLQFHAMKGMRAEIAQKPDEARGYFQTILDRFNPTLNQYAMAANSLGNIYYKKGNVDKAIEMMAKAAIADMKGSVKEGVALMTLAEFLYKTGDEVRAYEYIKQALRDATFYGAKQRTIQVAAILPIIEGERLSTVEGQRQRLYIYAIVVTVLSLLVLVFAYIIFRQLKQLREAKRTLTEAFDKLQQTNDELVEAKQTLTDAYDKLRETNEKLIEANVIKEEYIGYSFNFQSTYLDKIDKFKKSIDRKLMAKKYDEIGHAMKSINVQNERELLFQSFDQTFLKLFPNFVSTFNSYFKEEDRIRLKDKNSLNIELRIFALLRLGITDHEQVAQFLDYSVRTIYNYKTKVKNRSILPNDDFEEKIMEIKAF